MKKSFKTLLCVATGLCIGVGVQAQTDEIKTKTTYEVSEKGKKLIENKEERDERGRVSKEYIYDEFGELKKYVTYEYKGKKVISSKEYLPNGKLKESNIYEYNEQGRRTAKLIYDANGKYLKKKVYEYQYYSE